MLPFADPPPSLSCERQATNLTAGYGSDSQDRLQRR